MSSVAGTAFTNIIPVPAVSMMSILLISLLPAHVMLFGGDTTGSGKNDVHGCWLSFYKYYGGYGEHIFRWWPYCLVDFFQAISAKSPTDTDALVSPVHHQQQPASAGKTLCLLFRCCCVLTVFRNCSHDVDVYTDVFLTHNWGLQGSNHRRVSYVNKALREGEHPMTTWFDEERMSGDIRAEMIDGIDNAAVVVVFLTDEYVRKVNSNNRLDNCCYEFDYAFDTKGNAKMVVVVLERELLDPKKWTKKVRAALNGKLYVDMTNDPIGQDKIDELKRLVRAAV
jgi:hypothetical protein